MTEAQFANEARESAPVSFSQHIPACAPATAREQHMQRRARAVSMRSLARLVADATGEDAGLIYTDLATLPFEESPKLDSPEGWADLARQVGAPGWFSVGVN